MTTHQNRTPWVLIVLTAMTLLGSISLAIAARPAVPNDTYQKAIVIDSLPYSNTQDTVDAKSSKADPLPSCQNVGHTVWYTFTPSTDATITADTFGSDYDTVLTVYTRSRGKFTEVACNDDTATNLQSEVTFNATTGTTYYIMVSACCGNDAGNLVLNVSE